MKKLLALSAFIVLGGIAFAQTPVKQNTAPVAKATQTTTTTTTTTSATKAESKKESCGDADMKACGSKAGKKSCCSGKAEAKK